MSTTSEARYTKFESLLSQIHTLRTTKSTNDPLRKPQMSEQVRARTVGDKNLRSACVTEGS